MYKEVTPELLTALAKEYGSFDSRYGRLYLTQHPYPSDETEDCYCALAIDSDNNDYEIVWECHEGWLTFKNEEDVCDWDEYTVKYLDR